MINNVIINLQIVKDADMKFVIEIMKNIKRIVIIYFMIVNFAGEIIF